jgi:hypothetical protein
VSLKLLFIFIPVTLFASGYKKIITGLNVTRPMTLIDNSKNYVTIKPGNYKIVMRRDPGVVSLWFQNLDKVFNFKSHKNSENFTLLARKSGQPYTLTVINKKEKIKVKDYVETIKVDCIIDEAVKFEEECHPKLKWVPYEYRKIAIKKSDLFCYRRPSVAVRWGTRTDRLSVAVFSKKANIDLVDSRKSEIVASAHYREEETQKKVWKKGQCR